MRLILISFGFLAFAFYELSGGADFDPDAYKAQQIAAYEAEKGISGKPEPRRTTAPAPVVVASAPKVDVRDTARADAEVTRVALNLTTLRNVTDTAAETPAETSAFAEAAKDTETVPQNASLTTSSTDTPAIIPSLIDPNDGVRAEPARLATGTAELRTVAGNRVNVRGGPGTNFGVVGGLVRGDEIRVLEANGAGWVRFETLDGSTAGWMAEFLLTDS